MGKRQAIVACAFPPDQELACLPLQIIEGESGDFTGP
jgi:hypothetical protein